jgi:hypothetical protein
LFLHLYFLSACTYQEQTGFDYSLPSTDNVTPTIKSNITSSGVYPTRTISIPTPVEATTLTATQRSQLPTPTLVADTSTIQPSITANTQKPPHLPNTTQTPLPSLDLDLIKTSTPAQPALCPLITSEQVPIPWFVDHSALDEPDVKEQDVLNYLNTYGPAPIIAAHERSVIQGKSRYSFAYQDFTNDGVPELAFVSDLFNIFGCNDGQYQVILPQTYIDGFLDPYYIVDIKDGNRNGIPEILFNTGWQTQGGHSYRIYEWGGSQFRNLLLSEYSDSPDDGEIHVISAYGSLKFRDLNRDGIQELVAANGIPVWSVYHEGIPWRKERRYFKWDGFYYSLYYQEFDPPEYRFQAVQDGDRLSLLGEYKQALISYQQAIFSDELKWWSPELRKHLQDTYLLPPENPMPIPPLPDEDEYYMLAAYARYRIMLLHILSGWLPEAETVYNSLQEKFGEGQIGHIYAEMATLFWEEYQNTRNIAQSCGVVVEYAALHDVETLSFLGNMKNTNDFSLDQDHGQQSLEYLPIDVCPFK